jgi:hypothetical protein
MVRFSGWLRITVFNVLVTGDKTLHQEQNMEGRKIALVLLSAVSWPVIEQHVHRIIEAVDKATPGSFTRVDCGVFVRPGRHLKGPTLDKT